MGLPAGTKFLRKLGIKDLQKHIKKVRLNIKTLQQGIKKEKAQLLETKKLIRAAGEGQKIPYKAKDLKEYLKKIKKNIKAIEEVIEKEKEEIKNAREMIKSLRKDIEEKSQISNVKCQI